MRQRGSFWRHGPDRRGLSRWCRWMPKPLLLAVAVPLVLLVLLAEAALRAGTEAVGEVRYVWVHG